MCGPFTNHQLRNIAMPALELKQVTPSDALIVAVDKWQSQPYSIMRSAKVGIFSRQNGIYGGNPETASRLPSDLERLRRRGGNASCLCHEYVLVAEVLSRLARHLSNNATLIESTPEFRIYKLNTVDR